MGVGLILYVLGWFGQVRPDIRKNPLLYRAPLWLRILLGVPWMQTIEVSTSAVQIAGLVHFLVVGLADYGVTPMFNSVIYLGVAIAAFLLADFALQYLVHRRPAEKKQAGPQRPAR